MIIRKKEEYVVDGMGKISIYSALDATAAKAAKEPVDIYEGFAIIGAAQPNGQIMQVPVEFRIDGVENLDAAFAQFQEAATARFKAMMEEARQQAERQSNRIITAPAGAIPKMKLVTE
jgi:RPA family protein